MSKDEIVFIKPNKCPKCGIKNHLCDFGWTTIEVYHYDSFNPGKPFNEKDFYYECSKCGYKWEVKTKIKN